MPDSARALCLLLLLIGGSCRTGAGDGGFEDDAEGGDDNPLPPDLPLPSCDPRRVDDCDEGQKCSYVVDPQSGPTNRCVPILGDGQAGEPCEQIGDSDTCGAHLLCWGLEADGGLGLCVGFCSTTLVCADANAVCSVSTDGLLPLCLTRCDPLLQDCLPSWGCYPDPGKRWSCDRDRSGSAGAHGDPCDCLNCCDPGLICVPGGQVDAEGCGGEDGSVGCCAAICQLPDPRMPGDPPPCPGELEGCSPFYLPSNMVSGYEDVGVCRK